MVLRGDPETRRKVMRDSVKIGATVLVAALALLLSPSQEAKAVTVTLEALKDNTMYSESGSESNGAGDHFFAGRTNTDSLRRALIAFPIADSIPECATITGVTLTLHMSRTTSGSQAVDLHRLLADWGEGTSHAPGQEGKGAAATTNDATWDNTFFPGSFWANPGGDFSPTVSGSQAVGGIGFYSWSDPQMVADVQMWLDGPGGNFGWILIGNEIANHTAKRFDSRTNTTVANRPMLVVDYDDCAGIQERSAYKWGSIKAIYGR
jgi:hypothetical protein